MTNPVNPQQDALAERLRKLTPEQRAMLASKLALARGAAPAQDEALPEPHDGLSPSQQRMWLFEKIEGSSAAYNVVSALHLRGALDIQALAFAMNQLARRHEILRTRFVEREGAARQVIEPSVEIAVHQVDATGLDFESDRERVRELVSEQAEVNFRLDTLPLLHVAAIRLAGEEAVLVCVIHHILADGWSLRLLEQEISESYGSYLAGRRDAAEPKRLQYRHYVGQQKAWLEGPLAERQIDYWSNHLQDLAPALALPLEKPRELAASLASASNIFSVPHDLRVRLDGFAQAHSTSLFMVLAAAFKLTLSYVTGSGDIAVGTPVANRRERRFEDVFGLFSNTVVLRTAMPPSGSFRTILDAVRRNALDAYQNQDVPFEQVVDAVRPERSPSSTPLFQVLFALQSVESSALALPGLVASPLQMQRPEIEFDMIFECFFEEGANNCVLSYRTERLAGATIEQIQACFLGMLERGVAAPDAPIGELFASFGAEIGEEEERPATDAAAAFLAAEIGLAAGDRMLVDAALPGEMKAAAELAAARCGAELQWGEPDALACAEEWKAGAGGANILILRPSIAGMLETGLAGGAASGTPLKAVVVHGGRPGERRDFRGRPVVQCWSLAEAGGPFLTLRSGGERASVSYRGRMAAASAAGDLLPANMPGQIVFCSGTRAVETGLRGRVCADGLQIEDWQERCHWVDGQLVDSRSIEAALAGHGSVADAVVVPRVDQAGVNRLVAYVALNQRVSEEVLAAWLKPRLAGAAMPIIVLVTTIPLTRDGRADLGALEAMPAVSPEALAGAGDVRVAWADLSLPPLALSPLSGRDGSVETIAPAAGPAPSAHPALAVGAPLDEIEIELTLPALLERAAREHESRGMLHIRDAGGAIRRQSYAELAADASSILAGLRAEGLQPGERILLQLRDNADFLAGFWACAIGGLLPVMAGVPDSYDPHHKDTAKIVNAWGSLDVSRILCSEELVEPLDGLGRVGGCPLATASIETLRSYAPAADWHRPAPQDPAILLLTSGSTGVPKAVIQSHAALVRRTAATVQQCGFGPEVVSFNWMPLDHVGGIVMFHLVDIFLGADQLHCPTPIILADPLRWLDWLDEHRVTNTWAPNFAYALVNDRLDLRRDAKWDLSRLSFILNGGEAIVPRTARTFLRRLSEYGLSSASMVPAWGMSETCSGVTLNRSFDLGSTSDEDAFVDVGPPIPGVEIRIVDGQGRLVEEGRVGALQIRGATVTGGYFNNPDATEQAFTGDKWFVTGDLAVLRNRSLTITGREKDLIIINGLNYFGHEIEQVVEEVPGVLEAHVAACGVRRPSDETDRLAIFFSAADTAEEPAELARGIRRKVLERSGVAPAYIVPMAPADVPRTSIGKIERSRLADRFNRGEFDDAVAGETISRPTLPAWFFERLWVPRSRSAARARDSFVVVTGNGACGLRLVDALRAAGEDVVSVGFADRFSRLAADRFVLPASDEQAFRALFASLAEGAGGGYRVVHCGAAGTPPATASLLAEPQAALEPGLLSLAALARALPSAGAGRVTGLEILTAGAFSVTAGDRPEPAHGAVSGFAASLAQELTGICVRHIDIAPDADPEPIIAELLSASGDTAVALRGRRRLVPRLAPAALGNGPRELRRFDSRGFHLITGGLGGVGLLLAARLLDDPEAHVLVIGRSSPDDRREALGRFASFGSRFAYAALDVCDGAGLAELRRRYEGAWGRPLTTVFHLAGALEEGLVAETGTEAILRALRAKALGAIALHQGLGGEAVEFIHFGSSNGFFGGVGVAAYSAANSMLETISLACAQEGAATRCLSLSMWDGIGMSRDYAFKDQSAARGFALLDRESGLNSIALAAGGGGRSVLIGLDASAPNIACRLARPPQPLRDVTAPADGVTAQSVELRDRFGTLVPLLEATGGSSQLQSSLRPLREMEARLAQIWHSVLQIEVADPDANFFELGGDSIMAIQVVSRANQQGIGLLPRQLFECQTLAALAGAASASVRKRTAHEVLSGEVPLGPVQNWFFERNLGNPHHFNQSVVLRMKRRASLETVERSLALLVSHHDMLRARYFREGSGWTQRIEDTVAITVEEIDLAGTADAAASIKCKGSRLQASLHLHDGPLLRALCFRGEGADQDRLLIALHHLVVDGVSWRIIQEDLETLLDALTDGDTAPALPPRTSSYRAFVDHRRDCARAAAPETLAYWSNLAGQETAFPGLRGDIANHRSGERAIEIEIDQETTRDLLGRTTRLCGAEVNDVLLAALHDAYREWTGHQSLYLTLEGHGRPDDDDRLDLSRTVGWFTALFPLLLSDDGEAAIEQRVSRVKEQRRAVPDAGLSFGALRYLGDDAAREALARVAWPRLSFNYLGRFDVDQSSLLSFSEESAGLQQDEGDLRVNEVDVVGLVIDGRMKFSFNFNENRLAAESVAAFSKAFAEALTLLSKVGSADEALAQMPDTEWIGLDPAAIREVARELDQSGIAGSVETVMPLTPTQEGLLFDSVHGGGEGLYVSQLVNDLSGLLDAEALRDAWQQIVSRHAAYRTCFAGIDGAAAVQVVLRDAELPWAFHDWRGVPAQELEVRFEALLASDRKAGFALGTAPLLRITLVRLGESCHRMFLSEHHAVSDGWSRGVILRELAEFYRRRVSGEATGAGKAVSFARYVEWLHGYDTAGARRYWTEYLDGAEEAAPLAHIAGETPSGTGGSHRSYRRLSAERSRQVASAARAARATPSAIVQTAWGLLLSLYTGRTDVIFGTTHSGRPAALPGVETMVGPFINTLPVRLQLDRHSTVSDCVRAVSAMQLDHAEFGHLPAVDIKRASGLTGNRPLFETLFLVENFPLAVPEAGEDGLRVDGVRSLDETGFPLMVMLVPGERYELIVYYRDSHFTGASVDSLLDRFDSLLDQVCSKAEGDLAEIQWVLGEERGQLVHAWNRTDRDYPDRSVSSAFAARVQAAAPDAVALVGGGETLTYGALAARVDALAAELCRKGVRPETVVGVLLDRSPAMVVALLAVWRAGGAYLPLDPAYPRARLEHMLRNSGARLLLSDGQAAGAIELPDGVEMLLVDTLEATAETACPPAAGGAADLAYLMYTSGSTGLPKGIQVENGNVANFLAAMDELIPLGEGNVLLAVTSICFDISVLELFQPLTSGGTVVLASAAEALDPQHLQRLIRTRGVTHMQATPATWQMMLDDGWTNEQGIAILTGGDALPQALADRLAASGEVWNLYGPTEATVWSNAKRVEAGAPVTLGNPIGNLRCYVLDGQRRPLPAGIAGELYIAGAGVARGYLGQDELTAEKFLADDLQGQPGQRMYRTGDLVRWTSAGELEFLGRIDHQVKIRGFRVEIGEVERVLASAPEVAGAVVQAVGAEAERRLVAYLIASGARDAAVAAARNEALQRLPGYMHPAAYVVLDAFPLTQNGKIDRKALPQPEELWVAERVPPREPTATEAEVIALAAPLLRLDTIEPEGDFFVLGGNSILAAQLSSRLRRDMGVAVPVADIFEDSTIARLASRIDRLRQQHSADGAALEIHLF